MIVTRVEGRLRVVTQVAHQDQCGLLMRAWGNAGFTCPQPWDPVVAAAAVHDEGWREWERHPGVLPDGAPQGFVQMDVAEHVAIHRASARAAVPQGDHAALLVGMHGAGLVMRRMGLDAPAPPLDQRPEPSRALVMDHARTARRLRARLGEGAAVAGWAWAAYRVLQAIDLLSLYLTWRGLANREQWTLGRVPRAQGDEAGVDIAVSPAGHRECLLHPWPFALPQVAAPVEARFIDDRPYGDADDLAAALAAAPGEVLDFAVLPASART